GGYGRWPPEMIPLAYGGGVAYICIDSSGGGVYAFDYYYPAHFVPKARDLNEWIATHLRDWL
ncbi:MAG: hypothetical protein K2Q20_04990, partial [Phycisphaerales bacterium]|nr:hypothetical protein [Phycisphaerales bacterium]